MKKSQLFLALFLVAGTAHIFAGKTVRNSAEEPNARKQFLSQGYNTPTEKKITSLRVKSERIANSNLQKASEIKK